MPRKGVSRQEVAQACARLLEQGCSPTAAAIRAELGGRGSWTTLHRHLKALQETEVMRKEGLLQVPAVPARLLRLAKRLQQHGHADGLQSSNEEVLQQIVSEIVSIAREVALLRDHLQARVRAAEVEREAHEQTQAELQRKAFMLILLEQALRNHGGEQRVLDLWSDAVARAGESNRVSVG